MKSLSELRDAAWDLHNDISDRFVHSLKEDADTLPFELAYNLVKDSVGQNSVHQRTYKLAKLLQSAAETISILEDMIADDYSDVKTEGNPDIVEHKIT